MCYKIEASFILIHLLRTNEYCTFNDLVQKKYVIERDIPSVFIDVSRYSILSSIEAYPEIFEYRENRILKKDNSSVYFEESVIDYFDMIDVEDAVKSKITKLLAKM